jgi:hypothetical protein
MAHPMLLEGYDDVKTVNEQFRRGATAGVWADEIHRPLLRVAEAPHGPVGFGLGAPAYSRIPSGLIKQIPKLNPFEGSFRVGP